MYYQNHPRGNKRYRFTQAFVPKYRDHGHFKQLERLQDLGKPIPKSGWSLPRFGEPYRRIQYPDEKRPIPRKCRFRSFLCFGNILWDFCKETSMHGFNHIAREDRHPLERVLWATATALAIWGAVDISAGQWRRYNENPTVVTLEKDFRNWRFTFPALTICYNNRVDPARAAAAIKKRWNVDPESERFENYTNFVKMVASSELTKLEGFQDYIGEKELDVDLYQLTVDVMPGFGVKQAWVDSLDPRWLPVMTEFGACYTVNSLAIADIIIAPLEKPDLTSYPIECKYSAHTCYVTLEITFCIKVYTHSAYDISDVTDVGLELCPATQRKLELTVLESGCGRGVRQLAVRRRGCLYTDEPPTSPSPQLKAYSMSLCRRSCRNRLAMKLCGCRPYFNFYEDGTPCNISGMACLSKYSNELRTFTKASPGKDKNKNAEPEALFKCSCSPQCQDAVYQESNREDQIWLKGPFASRGSARYSVQAPRTRYSREIVFYFQDLVVSFGGAAGLFLGASFLSFVEILYFILERTLKPCWRLRPGRPSDVKPEVKTITVHTGASEHSGLQKLDTPLEPGQPIPQTRHAAPHVDGSSWYINRL